MTVKERCIHHWDVNLKNYGTCRKCDEGQQFTPHIEAFAINLTDAKALKKWIDEEGPTHFITDWY